MKRTTLLFVTMVIIFVLAVCTRLYASSADTESYLFETISESQKQLRRGVDSLEKMDMEWEKKSRLHDKLTEAQRLMQDAQQLLMGKK